MHRLQPEDWECPICRARGDCIECAGLGTYEDYQRVQALHVRAIERPEGIAARVLEHIEFLPELKDRAYWVSKLITGALRRERIHGV